MSDFAIGLNIGIAVGAFVFWLGGELYDWTHSRDGKRRR